MDRVLQRRARLLATSAFVCMATVGTAHAQVVGPEVAVDEPQGPGADLSSYMPETSIDDPQIVVEGPGEGYTPQPGQPGSVYDNTVNVTGVGQFYNAGVGGVCTGTLINPRTVIFAAHCVNDAEADSYGSNVGGTPAAFAFEADALPGLQSWFGAGFVTDESRYVYNISQILYNPESLANPDARGFLEADIALAALDTPASNVPTWALLFSALPVPDSISSEDGTGYNVRVNGYGRSGVGETGDTNGIDFRRRAAENVVGILGSLNDRNEWLFGPDDYGLPQNLYQTDFDDPNRENQFDFNLFKDDARDPEGSTAGGDSGGPLILTDTFDRELVIGVLSGGSRFFQAQPSSSYGTSSIYQPLYAFWDWIAANSPYRYTQTIAGDGAWTDPTHWETALDPNFFIIDDNGELVNGVPDTVGEGRDATSGKFGQVCDGLYCLDLATRDIVDYEGNVIQPGNPDTNEEGGLDQNNLGKVDGLALLEAFRLEQGLDEPQDGQPVQLAAAVGEYVPGTSGYVPNNRDFNPALPDGTRQDARYFDVTLAAAGTTTLNSTVEIDKLTIAGADAALDIGSAGSLTSLMDVTQMAGRMNVDGTIATNGDYLLFTGVLSGAGTVQTPYFTNMMGIVAPGTMGTIGTLDFDGNVILTSGSVYAVDLGASGQSDLIRINATQFDGEGDPTNGMASIGGTVVLNAANGEIIRYNDTFEILTAEGGYTGTFESPAISAILRPKFTYGLQSVTLTIDALDYADVIDPSSTAQTQFAQLLDQNRVQYDRYADLYGPLDLLNLEDVRSTIDSFAPTDVVAASSLGVVALNSTGQLIRNRLAQLGAGQADGGDLAVIGQPNGVIGSAFGAVGAVAMQSGGMEYEREGALPEDMSGFIAGGYINGDSTGLPASGAQDTEFDGYFIGGGLEKLMENGALGLAFVYTDLDTNNLTGQQASGQLYQGTLYGMATFSGLRFDAQISAGAYDMSTLRNVSVGGSSFAITGDETAFVFSSEAGLGKVLNLGAFDLTPRVAVRASVIEFSNVAENGGGPALMYNLGRYDSVQGRAGFTLAGRSGFHPILGAEYVHDFNERPAAFDVNFVGGVGPLAGFALPGTDQNWVELSGGIGYRVGNVDLAVSAETMIERSDISYQSYQASATIRF